MNIPAGVKAYGLTADRPTTDRGLKMIAITNPASAPAGQPRRNVEREYKHRIGTNPDRFLGGTADLLKKCSIEQFVVGDDQKRRATVVVRPVPVPRRKMTERQEFAI
jgi:hypothetical protein